MLPNYSRDRGIDKGATQTPATPRCCDIIEHWNRLPGNHTRHLKPGSGVYKETARMIGLTRRGQFGKIGPLDRRWMESRGLPPSWASPTASPRVTNAEMKEAVTVLSELFCPQATAKWVRGLPRSLNKLIYNPITCKSMLLWALHDGRRLVSLGKRLGAVPSTNQAVPFTGTVQAAEREILALVRHHGMRNATPASARRVATRMAEWLSAPTSHKYGPLVCHYTGGMKELLDRLSEFLDRSSSDFLSNLGAENIGPDHNLWERFLERELDDGTIEQR